MEVVFFDMMPFLRSLWCFSGVFLFYVCAKTSEFQSILIDNLQRKDGFGQENSDKTHEDTLVLHVFTREGLAGNLFVGLQGTSKLGSLT